MTAYVGYDGSGKTYHMTQVALGLIAQGHDVFSLHDLEGSRQFHDLREMLRMRRCHIFLDEFHQEAGSDRHDLDPVLKHVISQHRKYHMTIHWSAQSWWYMHPFVRRQTSFCWKHEAIWRDADSGKSRIGLHRAVRIAGLEEELKHRRPQVLAKRWIWIKPKIFRKYESYKPLPIDGSVVSDEEIARIRDPYMHELKTLAASDDLPKHPAEPEREQKAFGSDHEGDERRHSVHGDDEPNQLDAGAHLHE